MKLSKLGMKKMASYVGIMAASVLCLTACGGDGDKEAKEGGQKEESKKEYVVENNDMELLEGRYKKDVYYFVDGKGNLKTYTGYDDMESFHNGLAVVRRDNKEQIIDVDGKTLVEGYEIKVHVHKDGVFYSVKNGNNLDLYDANAKKLVEGEYVEYNVGENTEYTPDMILAEKADDSVDVYTLDGQFLFAIPAGYSLGCFYHIDANEYIGYYKIRYDKEYKYYNSQTLKEITKEEAAILNSGLVVEDNVLTFYDATGKMIKTVEIDQAQKNYHGKNTDGDFHIIEYMKADSWGEYVADVYDRNGNLLYSGNEGDVWTISVGDTYYARYKTDTKNALMNNKWQEVFSMGSGDSLNVIGLSNIFYVENEGGLVIYDTENFEKNNGKVYSKLYEAINDDAYVFEGEKLLIFNAYGHSCEIDKVEFDKVEALVSGYVALINDETIYIIDVAGTGKVHEAPKSAELGELVPYYENDDVYYNFKGEEIYKEE